LHFVDKAFARRLEAAEDVAQVRYARFYQQLRPEIGAAAEEICGGHMAFAGVGSPIGRAIGLGLDGPVSLADLGRMEGFYRSHQAPAQIDITPLHDPSLWELLRARGYMMAELNNVLYRPLNPRETLPASPSSVMVRPGHLEEAGELACIAERSFFPDGGAPKGLVEVLAAMYQIEGALPFVAEVEGKAVACSAGMAIPEHGIFSLFGAGTLPEFRGRGLQSALLRARLENAASHAGCQYAVVVTRGNTTSQRNCERLGFRLAYTKATLMRELK